MFFERFFLTTIRYAFGIILWEIAECKLPYTGANLNIVKLLVAEGEREEVGEDYPAGFKDLIQHCWQQDPNQRPHITQIIEELAKIKSNFVC
jgi:hypothetical protein